MIKNYLKLALRNLRKGKAFSLINIVGLAIGIACFMLIGAFVTCERSEADSLLMGNGERRVASGEWLVGGRRLNMAGQQFDKTTIEQYQQS